MNDDSSVSQLTEAERNRPDDETTVSKDEAFGDVVKTASATSETSSDPTDDNSVDRQTERIEAWLRRGQDAIAQAGGSRESSVILSEATSSFREVLRIDPDNADAFHGLATVSDLNEDWELADMNYKRALAARPNDVRLLTDQGYSYLLQNRFHEASRYLNRVLEISPHHEKAHVNLAILDIRRDNRDSALGYLERIYPAAKARDVLAGLIEEHQPSMAATIHGSRPISAHDSDPLITRQSGSQSPAPFRHGRHTSGQLGAAVAKQTQRQLFDHTGVIPTRQPLSTVPTVEAEGTQVTPDWVSQAAKQRTADGIPTQASVSPLDFARPTGGRFQLPPGHQNMRPQLPASANVSYSNPGTPGSLIRQLSGRQRTASMSKLGSGPRNTVDRQPLPYHVGQHQQPTVRPHYGQQSGSAPHTSANVQGPYNDHHTWSAGSHRYGIPAAGMNQFVVSPQTTNASPGINGSPNGSAEPPLENLRRQHPRMTNSDVRSNAISNHGVQTQVTGHWSPEGFDNQLSGTPGIQPATHHVAQPAPQHFSLPPVVDPRVTAPDSLDEYRAARRQLDNEYHQTLQTLRESRSTRSFQ
ncbi:MAG: hypothetical protein MK102_12125 [Fuerstiella sp.]|nr:hypothetical protein [Fuerstiella sp.]